MLRSTYVSLRNKAYLFTCAGQSNMSGIAKAPHRNNPNQIFDNIGWHPTSAAQVALEYGTREEKLMLQLGFWIQEYGHRIHTWNDTGATRNNAGTYKGRWEKIDKATHSGWDALNYKYNKRVHAVVADSTKNNFPSLPIYFAAAWLHKHRHDPTRQVFLCQTSVPRIGFVNRPVKNVAWSSDQVQTIGAGVPGDPQVKLDDEMIRIATRAKAMLPKRFDHMKGGFLWLGGESDTNNNSGVNAGYNLTPAAYKRQVQRLINRYRSEVPGQSGVKATVFHLTSPGSGAKATNHAAFNSNLTSAIATNSASVFVNDLKNQALYGKGSTEWVHYSNYGQRALAIRAAGFKIVPGNRGN